ncbi:proton/sodium-translocating pyrophosphatase [Singulisphaera acidiphila]|uniref:K(+)-insensitive pyrophosphate-energized proton pump n=1 Tax=Singulisphaera acidiphila (strain ATCC BAA-1392 / DSM 18658 / VKM B-2454 / MOB10) TaxID=886293 RepID=L0DFL3_SINAD|nr:sodium/proton-translocating pyrophosphatase [Singulisphaera acidiphila]AGA27441.1 inorganic pyrophosphatase [Singulisphaera acidiphila DSM 18658]
MRRWHGFSIVTLVLAALAAPPSLFAQAPAVPAAASEFQYFAFRNDPHYDSVERGALWVVLGVAVAGLLYAAMLVGQVLGADQGTEKMRSVAKAIRMGANAYLSQQFRAIILLVFIITGIMWAVAGGQEHVAIGRAAAFFMGAAFSWTVGYVGMSLAVRGNLRVAAAARTSYGAALQLGYRTGTITGMLTDGLGLLGGTLIFMAYGEHAYEVLLGFGFGGTLLALFMRVGGGIYTKAADVGADLVGKVEANIPEDDPRNAATIADNVGDNVGDCAGMAADIFESYEVTIVAAMILGYASFGHKGVIFPLLVRAIGVVGSIISTYTVKAGPQSTSDEALHSVHRGFVLGSIISVVGFFLLGLGYLHFDDKYIKEYPQALGGYAVTPEFQADREKFEDAQALDKSKTAEEKTKAFRAFVGNYDKPILSASQPFWSNFGYGGLDMRPAWTCLIGIILAIALNKSTSYYTHTHFEPVKSLAKACTTGHATNIIQGFALGYESTVVAVGVIAVALLLSVLIYTGASPIFIAYGVAMCGIGMLTLTGNTISMDVFGPVADNSNGIGEMGYDREEMGEENYKRARQILADLDAVGNTTKAETKGIAIGSAVIAAVSLFASFIAVIAVGSESKIGEMTTAQYLAEAGKLSVAQPYVFIGMLIGGSVPFLFSSMLIRAVGRAAFLIVKECRLQFRDPEIWAGTKTPDYGRVVNICTAAAQRELIGPGLLAILMPILVAIYLGPYALGGYLAGMIVVGQLLAVFMANAGGAWDNAKKLIEDGLYGGKGSEAHKASVTGDTVGDPLKDTAGPALNPLIKVMNMVALLSIAPILHASQIGKGWVLYLLGLFGIAAVAWAVWRSKTESKEFREMEAELGGEKADHTFETVGN